MRKWQPADIPANEEWACVYQIIVPKSYRNEIMRLAHEGSLGGHLGINKTCGKVLKHFFFGLVLEKTFAQYCKTCHCCQLVGKPSVKNTKCSISANSSI